MKNAVIIFLFLLVAVKISVAQKRNPPGTIWLRDNIYIDLCAINNIAYKEYAYTMSEYISYNLDSFQNIVASLPFFGINFKSFFKNLHLTPNKDSTYLKINPDDSIAWDKPADFFSYLNHPSYNNYPLVNMSYEQAKIFCAWRTAMVQLVYATATTESKRRKNYTKIRYRLATTEEWEYALNKFSNTEKFIRLKGPFLHPKNITLLQILQSLLKKKISL